MSQITTERTYTLIGTPFIDAKFQLSLTGELRIKLGNVMSYVNAPVNRLRFEDDVIALRQIPVTKITYEADDNAYWQITISRDDAEDLKRIIAANVESLKKLFGD